ncbi:MAG: hypothetical protein ABIO82_03370, partial [Ginsengibacter sp.]
KRSLSDNDVEFDARILLKRLRKRRDLFAAIADDIDELLDSLKKMTVSDIDPIQHVKPAPEKPLSEEELSKRDNNEEVIKGPAQSSPMSDSEIQGKPSQRQQLKGVMILGVSAMILGITVDYLMYGAPAFPFLLPIIAGGIIAGFICGGNTYRIIGAIIGMSIALYFFRIFYVGYLISMISSILFPSLGAGVVILFEKRKRKN